DRLRRRLAQERLDCVIWHDLVCSSLVRPTGSAGADDDLEAVWRSFAPADLSVVASQLVGPCQLGATMINGQDPMWETFETILLEGCDGWVARQLDGVSALTFLAERPDTYDRALI